MCKTYKPFSVFRRSSNTLFILKQRHISIYIYIFFRPHGCVRFTWLNSNTVKVYAIVFITIIPTGRHPTAFSGKTTMRPVGNGRGITVHKLRKVFRKVREIECPNRRTFLHFGRWEKSHHRTGICLLMKKNKIAGG